MKKILLTLILLASTLCLSSCYVREGAYVTPTVVNGYTVGYYPSYGLGNRYYAGYGWNNGYWSGYRGVYGTGWYNSPGYYGGYHGWYGGRRWR